MARNQGDKNNPESEKSIKKILDDIYGEASSSFYKHTIEGREIANRFTFKFKKEEPKEPDFIQKVSSLPVKAFIKCDYVKCGKPNCEQEHGPYYYGYWKDNKSKKLRKEYLGKL
ncbi:MAG: hypothetical protein R2685_04815 [Candidatus Nitrosocosmicus sp.]|nr:hypothetical protein [Candidatus Nitrosocosmicus sp.]